MNTARTVSTCATLTATHAREALAILEILREQVEASLKEATDGATPVHYGHVGSAANMASDLRRIAARDYYAAAGGNEAVAEVMLERAIAKKRHAIEVRK